MTDPADARIQRRARRVQWAGGLCFALLFLMGLSGLASVTLLHDDPLYTQEIQGMEGVTLRTVIALRPLIGLIHEWGGYAGILLAGWTALEVFLFGRLLRVADRADWRGVGRWIGPLGVVSGIVLIASLVLLLASGVAARGYVHHIAGQHDDGLSGVDRSGALGGLQQEGEAYPKSDLAEMHVRELNYLLAVGAILMVFAIHTSRRIQLEDRKQAKAAAVS